MQGTPGRKGATPLIHSILFYLSTLSAWGLPWLCPKEHVFKRENYIVLKLVLSYWSLWG